MRKWAIGVLLLVVLASVFVFLLPRQHELKDLNLPIPLISKTIANPSNQPIPSVLNVPELGVDGIPISEGHNWHQVSESTEQFAKCMTVQRLGFTALSTTKYVNDVVGAEADIFWLEGLLGPSFFYTDALQSCYAGVAKSYEFADQVGEWSASSMGTNGQIHSFAGVQDDNLPKNTILMAFWVQPGASLTSHSPAVAMINRERILYEFAKQGVSNPAVISCQSPRERPNVKIPDEVRAILEAKFADLAPLSIKDKYANAIDIRSESVTPHICVYSDGFQYALTGAVPVGATEAIELTVDHAPEPPVQDVETILMLAKIPDKGWVIVSEGSSPSL